MSQRRLKKIPRLAVDIIIEYQGKVILIKRKNFPSGWALPGGFVEYGETVEKAARREAKEETGLSLINLKQFHTYSDPKRDPRFHCVSVVFTAQGRGKMRARSDAKEVGAFAPDALPKEITFDHRRILSDYSRAKKA